MGTTIGFHEHDAKLTDVSATSLKAEQERLHDFDRRLAETRTNSLSASALYDYRIVQNAIKRELFSFEQMESYSRNPMTYAGVLDVNIYVKRNFAPLEQRVGSIT